MFKTILAPVDTEHPERLTMTLAAARQLAAAHNSKLILLHVLEQVPGYIMAELPAGFRENVRAEVTAELKKIAASHKLPAATEIMVRDGYVYHEILNVAQEREADLIVIASHNPVMADYLLGSVAARVVRHAQCSVLVLRAPVS